MFAATCKGVAICGCSGGALGAFCVGAALGIAERFFLGDGGLSSSSTSSGACPGSGAGASWGGGSRSTILGLFLLPGGLPRFFGVGSGVCAGIGSGVTSGSC